jgi:hypothetical protein
MITPTVDRRTLEDNRLRVLIEEMQREGFSEQEIVHAVRSVRPDRAEHDARRERKSLGLLPFTRWLVGR